MLNKVSVKGRGKISVVEHSRYHNIASPTPFQAKPRSDVKCIVSVVDDVSLENPARKIAPQCRQGPFAADDGRRVKGSR